VRQWTLRDQAQQMLKKKIGYEIHLPQRLCRGTAFTIQMQG
jgi:hypothetical protein